MEQTEPRVVMNLTLELNEEGRIIANTECDCRSRFEYETIVEYLEEMKQETIAHAIKQGNVDKNGVVKK